MTYVVRIGERKHLMDIMKVEGLDWRIPFREEGDDICSENRRERKHLMDIMKVEGLDWRIPFREE